jgi:hypothetical protein
MTEAACTLNCGAIFHMTGGQHRTDCPAYGPPSAEPTIEEEWAEIILLQVHLIDRIDRLVVRAGCKSRRELMERLAKGAAR